MLQLFTDAAYKLTMLVVHLYRCTTNVLSYCVSLFDPVSPRWQRNALQKFAANMSDSVTLECRVLAMPMPRYFWQLRGGNVSSSLSHQVSTTGLVSAMTVASVRASDYGNYTCVAVNLVSRSTFSLQLLPPGGRTRYVITLNNSIA